MLQLSLRAMLGSCFKMMCLVQVVLGRWSLQDDVLVGLRSPKWADVQGPSLAACIGSLSNVLPIPAALNKSVTFCLLVNRVGAELAACQPHAMLPASQMAEDGQSVCQASMSLASLAIECCSGFAAKEVPRPVRVYPCTLFQSDIVMTTFSDIHLIRACSPGTCFALAVHCCNRYGRASRIQ